MNDAFAARWTRLRRRFAAHLADWLLWPPIGGFAAVLTVLAGALASFFQTEIITHFWPWPFSEPGTVSWKATAFWLSVFGVGFLLMGTQWAQGRQASQGRRELADAIRRIESLPPENFLTEYQKLLRTAAGSVLVGVQREIGLAEMDKAVRNVLHAIVGVVKAYDMAPSSAVYAANIMLYRRDGPVEAAIPVGFVEGGAKHPDHDGCLELVRALSMSEREAAGTQDSRVAELVIPVPRNTASVRGPNLADLHPVLPGAAWAFVHREFAGFDSIERVDQWLRERCSASEEHKEQIRSYFRKGGAGAHIHSFASMPLLALHELAGSGRPLGVLNLHSEQPGLAAERGGDRLSPLLEPFRMMLSILLTARGAYFAPRKEAVA